MNTRPVSKQLNLITTISVVAGSMIGSGIFLLPAPLAHFGGISMIGWLFSATGAVLFALSLGRLSRRLPKAGGPYAYVRHAFGDFLGFLVGWGYWICVLTAGAAIATAFVGYLGVFIPGLVDNNVLAALAALALIWGITGVNIFGVKETGRLQLWTTILKLVPLFVVIFLGVFFFEGSNYEPFNLSEMGDFDAITATASMTLWAFLGMECASIIAEYVEEPEKNVARATTLGVLLAAVVYILSCGAVIALVPPTVLAESTAPFADAAASVLGGWATYFIAIGAVIACIGALNGATLSQGQMPFAMGRDGLFHSKLGRLSDRGTPSGALIVSAILVTLLMFSNYTRGLVDLYKFLILLATLSALLPFAGCALAELVMARRQGLRNLSRKQLFSAILAFLALCYALWAISGMGLETIAWGFALLGAGVPIFFWFRRN